MTRPDPTTILLGDATAYTVKGAAQRVRRSTRTIERWLSEGMPSRKHRGITVIDRDTLIAEMIRRNRANPTKRATFAQAARESS